MKTLASPCQEPQTRKAPISTSSERHTLRHILERAGEVALASFHQTRSSLKPDGTQVTVADVRSEAILVEALSTAFPGAGIVAEEGERVAGDDTTWFVDPIDGTGAFIDGLAHWGPSVCLVDDEGPLIGATWFPLIGEFWYARRGQGAWRNDTRLHNAPLDKIQRNHCALVPSRFHHMPPVDWPGKVRALGSTAAHLALVAGGGPVATVVGGEWRMWDVGAGSLLVQESGRVIVDMRGDVYHPVTDRGAAFIAGDARAVDTLVPLIEAARKNR